MPMLYLVRGLPGSGKSTFAAKINADHFEADMWMYAADAAFDASRLPECHQHCQNATKAALDAGRDVVVSNTFSQRWEMLPYYEMGYPVTEMMMLGNYGSIHAVPEAAVTRMRARWEF